MNNITVTLTDQEHATVLAALRYYQAQGLADDPTLRSDEIHDIATNADALMASSDGKGIDALCERINGGAPHPLLKLAEDYLAALNSSDTEHPDFLDSCADSVQLLWENDPEDVRKIIADAKDGPR